MKNNDTNLLNDEIYNIINSKIQDEFICKTLDEAVLWLSKQEHPMGYSGCNMSIGLYININNKNLFLLKVLMMKD